MAATADTGVPSAASSRSSSADKSDLIHSDSEWLGTDTDFPSNLLNLEFTEETDQVMNTPLYVSPFEDPVAPRKDPSAFATVSPFVPETTGTEADAVQAPSVNPQLVLRTEEMLAHSTMPLFVPLTQVKRDPDETVDLDALESVDEVDEGTFTAFTPMRLDRSSTCTDSKSPMREESPPEENWRLSREEYNKLSSKEKRQMRNKVSARNFRNRRKEYITLLEEQVSDRDQLIHNLRDQLSMMRVQNTNLSNEVRILQTRSPNTVDMSKLLGALQRSADGDMRPSSPLSNLAPNSRKDLSAASQTTSASPSFWGGVANRSVPPALVA